MLANGEQIAADHVVLAIGHSARDTFPMLHERGVYIEAKPFSIGVRIEHPQSLIDRARFGATPGIRRSARPITSWCITPATAARSIASACARAARWWPPRPKPGCVVTNGMSQYSRTERNANAGIVVGITPADYPDGPLAGIAFQRAVGERRVRGRRRHLRRARRNASAIFSPAARPPRWAR